MRAQKRGRIIVVTSIAAKESVPNLMLSEFIASGLHGLVNALSKEVAGDQITVNALMPGYQLTERLIELNVDEAKASAAIPRAVSVRRRISQQLLRSYHQASELPDRPSNLRRWWCAPVNLTIGDARNVTCIHSV
jgi:NAD(P)-dependent dehydrogenase (short-subunit alcohol dehydrogenase family)